MDALILLCLETAPGKTKLCINEMAAYHLAGAVSYIFSFTTYLLSKMCAGCIQYEASIHLRI